LKKCSQEKDSDRVWKITATAALSIGLVESLTSNVWFRLLVSFRRRLPWRKDATCFNLATKGLDIVLLEGKMFCDMSVKRKEFIRWVQQHPI